MNVRDRDARWVNDLTESDLDELAEAFDDAVDAGRRHDGKAAVRAWDEAMRDEC